jgi:hypothetical protein
VADDLLLYPDMTLVARKYLLAGLAEQGITGVPVASRIPSPLPEWFIRCYALPGRETCRRVQWCQVIVRVYGTDDVFCSQMARICAAVMRNAPEMEVDVFDTGEKLSLVSEPSELHGPFPSEDPDLPDWPVQQFNLTWTVQSQLWLT